MKAKSNVYTVLMLIAALALGGAVTIVWMKNLEITEKDRAADNQNPFYIVDRN